jgi:hypothetical protein
MSKSSGFILFIFGLILGIAGTILLPAYVRPYIPEWAQEKTTAVKGTVMAKQKKGNTLLLTVNTPEGALLATFTRKVSEVNLLVNEQDVIEFTLTKYAPLIDDPKIIRIIKEPQTVPEPAPAARPADKSAKEQKPPVRGR